MTCSIAGAAQHVFFHAPRSSQSSGGSILGLSCVPSNAGVWALREFKLETREDSAMIEVWKFLVGAAPSTSRVREAGAAKLPGGASFNFNARTREVSRRTGSGAALEVLGSRDPQKGRS